MPTLNQDMCYSLSPAKAILTAAADPLNMRELANQLATYSGINQAIISTELNKKIGPISTYTYKEELIDALKIILEHLLKPEIDDGFKRLITGNLLEGIALCTPGFHDRVNMALMSLNRPQSIDDFLELIRHSIVDATARGFLSTVREGMEVHHYNSFFTQASSLGFGIRPINSQDTYSIDLTPEETEAIKKTFETRYTPFKILTALRETIEGELRSYYHYKGHISSESGYEYGVYNKFHHFFQQLLDPAITIEQMFLQNEDTCAVQDINWLFIEHRLWKKLLIKGYIYFNDDEKSLLDKVYATFNDARMLESAADKTENDQKSLKELLNSSIYRKLILQFDWYNYLCSHNCLSDEIKKFILRIRLEATIKNPFSVSSFISIALRSKRITLEQLNEEMLAIPENERIFCYLNGLVLSTAITNPPTEDKKISSLIIMVPKADLSLLADSLLLVIQLQVNALDAFMKAIFLLPHNEIVKTFTDALMLIASQEPHHLSSTLSKILKFNMCGPTCMHSILTMVLRQVVTTQASAVKNLLEVVSMLEPADKIAIFKETDMEGNNILMLAAQAQPSIVYLLVNQILDLPTEDSLALLTRQNAFGDNALMLAAKNQGFELNAVYLLSSLSLADKAAVLKAKNTSGRNVLMIAAVTNEQNVDILLRTIITLPKDDIVDVLTTKDIEGNNVLMLAARYQPNSLGLMLNTISMLPIADRVAILSAKDKDRNNALMMLAAHHEPKHLDAMLKVLATLPMADRAAILADKNKAGINAIMALRNQRESFTLLAYFKGVSGLNIQREKSDLINTTINKIDALSPLMSKIKTILQVIRYNADDKKIAMLIALENIKTNTATNGNYDAKIKAALLDPNSELYKACDRRRYFGFASLFGMQSNTLRELQQVAAAA